MFYSPSGHPRCIWLSSQSHNIITSTGLNLINCKHIHYSPSSTLLLCVHTRYNLFAHSLAHPCFLLIFIIHSILYCTFYLIAHLTSYFISLFVPIFILTYIYIYIFSCVMFHCFIAYVIFILFYFLFYYYYYYFYIFCTFHWADLSWPTFHYWLYPVWLWMWQIIKNLEPWTLIFQTNLIRVILKMILALPSIRKGVFVKQSKSSLKCASVIKRPSRGSGGWIKASESMHFCKTNIHI